MRAQHKQPGKLLIRADGDHRMGTGHVMRCLALAQAWQRRGGQCFFCCVGLAPALRDRLEQAEILFVNLDPETVPGSKEDAEATVALAETEDAAAVFCDGYAFGTLFQEILVRSGRRTAIVADYPLDTPVLTDLLVNQNLGFSASDYPGARESTKILTGPVYSMLRQEFLSAVPGVATSSTKDSNVRNKILVTLGGADPENTSGRILERLGLVAAKHAWVVRVVVGGANAHREAIEDFASRFQEITMLTDVSDMAPLLEWSDLAISAGGSTVWECCLFGVPMILLSIADNQDGIVENLAAHGAALSMGRLSEWEESSIPSLVESVLNDESLWNRLSQRARSLVDGRGADRVAAALDGKLKIVVATAREGWARDEMDEFLESLRGRGHKVTLIHEAEDIPEGDVAFYLSFWSLVPRSILARNTHNLVVHASDLPRGKGWSPMTWQILEGKQEIPVRLFEAEEAVDSGNIYLREKMILEGHELLSEWRAILMEKTFALCLRFIDTYPEVLTQAEIQAGEDSFYARRGPEDSRLEPSQSLQEQFNLLRTVDNQSYPAYFDHLGHRFHLTIEKVGPAPERSGIKTASARESTPVKD